MRSSAGGQGGRHAVPWVLIGLYFINSDLTDAFPKVLATPLNTPIAIVIPLLFGLLHGARRYGWSGILVFLVLCLGISNVMENIGVMTGFPFGRYHYTDVLGPKLFLIPILIGPAYFGTSYLSWVLANILLDSDRRTDLKAMIGVPIVSTFLMVAWDVCLDPGSSTLAKIWIWERGGEYFGVPFVNYLGWYLTVFLFLMTFSVYNARRTAAVPLIPKAHWYQASAFYAVMALDFVGAYIGAPKGTVADAAGKVWQITDLLGTGTIMGLFVMLPFAILSLVKMLLQDDRRA